MLSEGKVTCQVTEPASQLSILNNFSSKNYFIRISGSLLSYTKVLYSQIYFTKQIYLKFKSGLFQKTKKLNIFVLNIK